jgi:hypothetical protein
MLGYRRGPQFVAVGALAASPGFQNPERLRHFDN